MSDPHLALLSNARIRIQAHNLAAARSRGRSCTTRNSSCQISWAAGAEAISALIRRPSCSLRAVGQLCRCRETALSLPRQFGCRCPGERAAAKLPCRGRCLFCRLAQNSRGRRGTSEIQTPVQSRITSSWVLSTAFGWVSSRASICSSSSADANRSAMGVIVGRLVGPEH